MVTTQGEHRASGPQLPGSACLPRPIQRHDAFPLNDRDQPSRSHLPPIVSTGRVPSSRTGQRRTSGPPGTEGPSASTRQGRIDEKPTSSTSSRPRPELGAGPARPSRHPQRAHRTRRHPSIERRRVPRRPEQCLIEQCHLQCFRAIDPLTSSAIAAFRPNDAALFSAIDLRSFPARPERRRAGPARQTFHIPATSSRSTGPARGNVIAFCQVPSLRPGQWRR